MSEDPAMMRFEVLGPLRAVREGEELALGGPRQQAVLAALLLRAGRPVSRDDLVDAVWGPEAPPTAAGLIHTYVAHLRKILEPARIRGAPGRVLASAGPGYVLRLAAGQLDMQIAEQQLDRARGARVAGDLSTCAAALDTALALWHGTPLAGIPGPLASIERDRLAELRLAALENRAETLLGLNQAAEVIGELSALAARYPFRERLAGLLMRALYRSGRQAEALAAYQRVRRRLVDELGVEPGPELQQLHNDILNSRELVGMAEPGQAAADGTTPPRQLPPAVRHFTGRRSELAALAILTREAARAGGTVVISAIGGAAGVGKTALAVHFAHEIATSFPDGQLYVDLRGFAPSGTPVGPGEALRGFLAPGQVRYRELAAESRKRA